MAKSSRESLKHTASSSSRQSNINDLPDELLKEIFCRLECPSAVRCMAVRKCWYALISHPDFVRSLIRHHHRLSQMQQQHNGQVFFSPAEPLLNPKAPTLEAEAITRRFLFGLLKDYKILGESNGWLCCAKCHDRQNIYYICNPLTNYWLELPPAPSQLKSIWGFGFLCDPFYQIDDETHDVTLNSECRFVVVRVTRFDYSWDFERFEVFSSSTGRWSNLSLSGFPIQGKKAVAFHGKLYFLGKNRILTFDPFKNSETCITKQCNYIEFPQGCVSPQELVITSSGSLGIFQILFEEVNVWELKEETWSFQEKKNIKEIAQNFMEAYTILTTSGDIFTFLSSIAAAQTRVVICPDIYSIARYRLHEEQFSTYISGELYNHCLRIYVFPMVLPWWHGLPLNYPPESPQAD